MKTLIISDIHGNADALRAVVDAEDAIDHTIFLGDALLAGPQANETAAILKSLDPEVCVMGNHDEEVLDRSLYASWPDEWVALHDWILDRLDKSAYEYIRGYSPAGRYTVGGVDMYLHHGEIDKSFPKILPNAPNESFLALESDGPLTLFGHTHVQFERQIGGTRYINPGSVGQPRCGIFHACYGVIVDGEYSPKQVTYDPSAWLDALANLEVLDDHPQFREWMKNSLLSGYGIGEREPWTSFAAEGYF